MSDSTRGADLRCVCRGYVLKPDWMLTVDPLQPVPDRAPRTLNVHVFSAFRPQVGVVHIHTAQVKGGWQYGYQSYFVNAQE